MGSAHHHPRHALATSPSRSVNDSHEHASVSFASARRSPLPSRAATRSLAMESSGMTTRDATAIAIPGVLASGGSDFQSASPALTPT